MQQFYIIADDLTGANDAGVQLSKIGITSTVFLDFNGLSFPSTQAVAIVDTDSRALSGSAAYQRVFKASSILYKQGYDHVYKKLDSTLRGNVAAELAAVVSVHQPDIVVVAPSYPKMNRCTSDGHQLVNGLPVSETEFGQDPKTPVTDSYIPNLLKEYVDDEICLIDRESLNSSTDHLKKKIVDRAKGGRTWFICDAMEEKDLESIANVFAALGKKTVWAGSAGLIEFLPDALQLKKVNMNQQDGFSISRTLTVSASLSNVTKQQLAQVRNMNDAYLMEVNPVDLIRRIYNVEDVLDEFTKHSDKNHFVLFVDSSVDNRNATKQLEKSLSLTKAQIGEAIARELGVMAEAVVQSFPDIKGLVLTGGDTAKAVCSKMNMSQLQLYTEVEAGLPIGKMSSHSHPRKFWTVTKAGGFGNEHSLSNALKYMTREVE